MFFDVVVKEKERMRLYKGNIIDFKGQCVVNAANELLLGGGGVDGVIHQAAGPLLRKEKRNLSLCRWRSSHNKRI